MVNDMVARATVLVARNTKEQAAKKISAEFPAAAYVSKNKLWSSYRNEKGEVRTQVLA